MTHDKKTKFTDYMQDFAADFRANNGAVITASHMVDFEAQDDVDAYNSLMEMLAIYNENANDLVKLKESLNTTKKLESLGTMAAGMAHEFNNVLQPIAGFADIMMQADDLPESHYEWLDVIHKSAYRGSALVDQIMNFSRKDKDSKKEDFFVSDIMSEFFDMVSLSKDLHIELELDNFVPHEAKVFVNKSEIHQVLINLYNNSLHAVADRQRGVIKVLCSTLDQQTNTSVEDEYIAIEVVDNGYGIPKKALSKIFEPFYTTKKIGEGTGLGLSIISNIVKGNSGQIHVDSEEGIGTTFKILLKRVV